MSSKLKILLADTAIYGAFTILQRFLTFFLTPFYTNVLLQEDLGNVYYVYTILSFFNVLYSFGMENAFFRFYRDNDSKKVFSTIFLFVISIGAVISSIMYFTAPSFHDGSANFVIMLQYSAIVKTRSSEIHN